MMHLPKNVGFYLLVSIVLVTVGLGGFLIGQREGQRSVNSGGQVTSELPSSPPRIGLTLLASGLGSPTGIVSTPDPSDSRLFIVDRAGVIRIINEKGVVEREQFLDIRDRVLDQGEMGLLGLAFHPKFSSNGQFYVVYSDKNQTTTLARFKVLAGADGADKTSEKILLRQVQRHRNHKGGDLTFGPDGYLYVAIGDGGSSGDPQNNAQNLNDLRGKIIRIDVDKGDPYAVPTDNPFVNTKNAKDEIWAYGLRNPWRVSFDRQTGDMWIGDVGQGKMEEVNFAPVGETGGKNYGWRCYEGSLPFNFVGGCRAKDEYIFPVVEYSHTKGVCASVTGGYVYRGKKIKDLRGKYLYADYCNGQVYTLEQKDDKWLAKIAIDTPYKISTFGQGGDGELYLADIETGSVYLIQETGRN